MNTVYKEKDNVFRTLYLTAVGGDLSSIGGASNYNVIVPFDESLLPKVAAFVRAALDYDMALKLYNTQGRKLIAKQQLRKKYLKFRSMCELMFDYGIFKDKYHTRTDWSIEYIDTIENYGPYLLDSYVGCVK